MCAHHYQVFLKKYSSLIASKWCSNPFFKHRKNYRGTNNITLALADAHPDFNLIPGSRLCQACWRHCFNSKKSGIGGAPHQARDAQCEQDDVVVAFEACNEALVAIGESPLQRKRGRKDRETYAQKKVRKLKANAEKRIFKSLGLHHKSILQRDQREGFVLSDYLKLMQDVKEKFGREESRETRIQLLTLAPSSWSRQKTMDFFGASERQVRQALNMRTEGGVLGTPPKRRGRPLSEGVKASIINFYEDDAVSYCLPGKKDVLKGRQKRLLLLNLKEMHEEWKISSHLRCGFSTFASLRPSHCVLAGGSGTHTVCVCMQHQNFKLMIQAAGLKESAEKLLATSVCELGKEECMLGACAKCPGTNCADILLSSAPVLDSEQTDCVQVQQWIGGVRCQLETILLTPDQLVL